MTAKDFFLWLLLITVADAAGGYLLDHMHLLTIDSFISITWWGGIVPAAVGLTFWRWMGWER